MVQTHEYKKIGEKYKKNNQMALCKIICPYFDKTLNKLFIYSKV